MTDTLKILLGGLLAILGGFIATWYQAKKARKIRMDEVIAVKKVDANAEAYVKMKGIVSLLAQSKLQDALKVILANESWLFSNRLFLPGKFPDKWLTIRNNVNEAIRLEKQPEKAKELAFLKKILPNIADEAIDIIYKDMEVERIEVEKIQSYDNDKTTKK